jgi:endonuclease/exonuclease/phosphatase (EEP) superfamily protein YafD
MYLISLAYPLFLLFNVLFVFYWIYQFKLHLILSLIVILLGYNNLTSLVSFNTTETEETNSDFSIMSFNVRLLNKYNWIEKENIDAEIFDYIQKVNPDIVAFQEFINDKKEKYFYIKQMKALGYPYYKNEPGRITSHFFGLITFSKFKITETGVAYQYGTTNHKSTSIYTDIKIKKQTIRVYNTHLNSLKFIGEDYQFVENITKQNEKETIQKSKNILTKVMVSARKREIEVKAILAHINESPYPCILLGDFNEPPYSYAYPKFSKTLTDPFLTHKFGVGTTFDGIKTIPGLRLDFILHSNTLVSNAFETGPKDLSDHRPITSWFQLPE